ncbi:hypothetical protein SISNIDRAFT_551356 [Sistotremastrum niveocremeum HHB9708]|uniref:Uncharacterized protein n=1 Tax=Sistotremastrum niveocremeum HHB9708 TaxID=1314777 RepID=A0A164RPS8_9AGAM|nr:hypothetical protein SISNIDRAFT_551356 [Sistotremastrum niveocremeum HHB9708]
MAQPQRPCDIARRTRLLAERALRVPTAKEAPVPAPDIQDLNMSEGVDLSGMQLIDDLNVIDEQAFLKHGEKVLDKFDEALAKGRGNHVIDGDLTFDDYGRRPKSKKQTAKAKLLHQQRLKDGSYRPVRNSGVWKDRDGKIGIVYLSWADLASGKDIAWEGLPPGLQNLGIWASQQLFAECPCRLEKKKKGIDPRHEMYRELSDVLGVECLCNKDIPPPSPLLGMTEGNPALQNKIRQAWQERVKARCQRDSVGVSPGYLDGKEWTESELEVLGQEDFEPVDEVDEDDDVVEDVGDSTGDPNDPTRLGSSDAEVRFGSVLEPSSPNLEPDFGSVLPLVPGPEPDAASGPQSVRSGSNAVRTL